MGYEVQNTLVIHQNRGLILPINDQKLPLGSSGSYVYQTQMKQHLDMYSLQEKWVHYLKKQQ